mgnify:CR=1 FL=1
MAWGATLFGFSMWARLLSLYPASQVAPFALLIPVAGIGSAALLLGDGARPALLSVDLPDGRRLPSFQRER